RRDPRGRLPPAHPIDTAALCDRLRCRRAVGRLLLLQRTQGQVMTLAHERTSQFFEGMRQERRQILTPEGVPIPVELGDHGERLPACVLHLLICILLTLAIYIPVLSLISYPRGNLIAVSIGLFIGFLVRNLYFVFFEIAWRGATPGKRIVGLRVIDRSGGPLLPSAVVARNLTREVECFI